MLLLAAGGFLASLASFDLKKIPTSEGSAVCNDGSPYAYYLSQSGSKNWVFFQNGGSYCWDKASCDYRKLHSSNQMTSNGIPASVNLASGIMSNDPAQNPHYATWNMVDLL
jgi:hypothetical protein